ncbi:MAG: hypothetical protein E7068_03165 [Lentimicrobiaceae bacterium]|nr:hypothetical protein [Lentimicrobiaceae bacterium]
MRKILIILLLFCCSNYLVAQIMVGEPFHFCALNGEQYNPGTHNNVEGNDWVVTKSDEDYTRYEKAFISERFNDDYSNHTIIGDPTVSYNCHRREANTQINGATIENAICAVNLCNPAD